MDSSNRDELPPGAVGGLDVQLTEADLEERNKRRILVKERVTLTKASPEMWTDEHDAIIDAWFNDDNLRYMFEEKRVCLSQTSRRTVGPVSILTDDHRWILVFQSF